jgi:membrane fusion protein, multidrug efflux system
MLQPAFASRRALRSGPRSFSSLASGGGAAAALLLALAACSPSGGQGGGHGGPGGGGGGGMPPMPVGVITVQPGEVALGTELPGRLEAFRSAQVRARVPGIVQKRAFTEGALVREGQLLFTLDSASQRAALGSAQAGVARAEAALAHAAAQLERNAPLAAEKAISQQEWLATQTAHKQAKAELEASQAAVTANRVNLGYTAITAPIGGRIGRAQVSEGALVGPTDPTPLALIQQTDPLYINFTQSAADAMKLRKDAAEGRLRRLDDRSVQVQVVLEDGSVHPQPGRLLFADPTVDAATGQMVLRAELPNPGQTLLPGLFVRVRMVQSVSDKAVLVPQQAVTREAGGDSLFVVGADNKPAPRSVRIAGARAGQWIVVDGLQAGERVVVDGFQKMRPGVPVNPVPWAPPQGTPGAAPAPASAAEAAASAPAPAPAASR